MGGDCLNVGCVPSKLMIRSGRVMSEIRQAGKYGIEIPEGAAQANFSKVMERLRKERAGISDVDSCKRFTDAGVDVYLGAGQFTADDTFEVAGEKIVFKKAVICTGARAVDLPIDGLKEAGYMTNETVFELTELPRRLLVIGGGPIGCELSQAFNNLGSDVTLVDYSSQFLVREDPDAAKILADTFAAEGIHVRLKTKVLRVWVEDDGKHLELDVDGMKQELVVDAILCAAGRAPNVENLGLEKVGVEYDNRKGVFVNDNLRTSNPRIFAAGDICMAAKFTHTADAAAQIVIQNALFFGRKKLSDLMHCTHCSPGRGPNPKKQIEALPSYKRYPQPSYNWPPA